MDATELAALIVATGALGTTAFGLIENFKDTRLGVCGFKKIHDQLGALFAALEQAYGTEYEILLKAQYREGRTDGQFVKTLRQGVRVGLTPQNAAGLANLVGSGVVTVIDLQGVAGKQAVGDELNDAERRILARFELAVDARIDAALALGNSSYIATMRRLASLVAIGIALLAGVLIAQGTLPAGMTKAGIILRSLFIGVAAIPFAPVAKDLAKALTSADNTIRGRS